MKNSRMLVTATVLSIMLTAPIMAHAETDNKEEKLPQWLADAGATLVSDEQAAEVKGWNVTVAAIGNACAMEQETY